MQTAERFLKGGSQTYQVKYLLELLEGDPSLIYSEHNNTLVTILTVLGLLLALWQILPAF